MWQTTRGLGWPPAMSDSQHGCDGFRRLAVLRRQVLTAGGLAVAGLDVTKLFAGRALGASARATGGCRRARACILFFQWGGRRHLDTWAPMHDAPAEIRGYFAAIEPA